MTPATSLYEMHQTLAGGRPGYPDGHLPVGRRRGARPGRRTGCPFPARWPLCDQLTSASVVLPNGQAVTASANSNPDLFWALRGGGGGNFGVTTSLTFATFPTGGVDVVNLNFPPESFAQVLVGWQNWLRTADRNSWALADATVDGMGTHCRIMATCPAGSGGSVASAITSAVGVQPTGTDNHTFNYLDLVSYLAVGNLNPSPLGYVGGSDVFPTITPAAAKGIAAAVDAFPRGGGPRAGDHACARRRPGQCGDREPPPFRGAGSPRWCSGTSRHPVTRRRRPTGSTPHTKRCNRIRSAAMSTTSRQASRLRGTSARTCPELSAVRQKYDPGRVMFSPMTL